MQTSITHPMYGSASPTGAGPVVPTRPTHSTDAAPLRLPTPGLSSTIGMLLTAVLVALPIAAAQQGPGPVEVMLDSYLVTVVTLEDGSTEERFEANEQAFPGQILEYRLDVSNVSDEALPPTGVTIVGPIPDGTSFVAASATLDPDRFRFEASIDAGNTFVEPPVIITVTNDAGEEEQVVVDPTAYQAIRWTILEALEPGTSVNLIYRVRIDE